MTKLEIGQKISDEYLRSQTIKAFKKAGVTLGRVAKRISEGLDANENKVFYDKDRGKCVVGPDMINWAARQKAIDQAVAILDIKPAEKHDVTVTNFEDALKAIHEKRGQKS